MASPQSRTFIAGRPMVTVYRQGDGLRDVVIETRHIPLGSPDKVARGVAYISFEDIDAVICALQKVKAGD